VEISNDSGFKIGTTAVTVVAYCHKLLAGKYIPQDFHRNGLKGKNKHEVPENNSDKIILTPVVLREKTIPLSEVMVYGNNSSK
jgi:hypothetical protein